jgi:Sec-independent protein translocase protein TatA
MGPLGVQELILIVAIALLIFAPSKLGDAIGGIGKGISTLKRELQGEDGGDDAGKQD